MQIEKNGAAGTFSPLLFSVTEYASKRSETQSISQPLGLDLTRGVVMPSANNNDGAFLKAVLKHLLDGESSV